jgi:hypothetical protein
MRLATHCFQEFHVDESDPIGVARVRKFVDAEIKLQRCNRLISVNPAIVVVTTDEHGNLRKKLNPLLRFELLLMKERDRALRSLRHSAQTERDNSKMLELQKQMEARKAEIIRAMTDSRNNARKHAAPMCGDVQDSELWKQFNERKAQLLRGSKVTTPPLRGGCAQTMT